MGKEKDRGGTASQMSEQMTALGPAGRWLGLTGAWDGEDGEDGKDGGGEHAEKEG